ncbi:MAG: addiction module toxin, HicA family [Deltaproteobacteria bacterium]|nr:addiction module toxin, HicA family [Deltaproteobacteria bacterium]
MKRRDLLRRLRRMGCILLRKGGRHDWYHNPATGMSQPVPRHTEIAETLAKHILKMLEE